MYRVLCGYKVRAGRVDNHATCAVDMHTGADPGLLRRVLLATIWVLGRFPDECSERDFQDWWREHVSWDVYFNLNPVNGGAAWEEYCRLAIHAYWEATHGETWWGRATTTEHFHPRHWDNR